MNSIIMRLHCYKMFLTFFFQKDINNSLNDNEVARSNSCDLFFGNEAVSSNLNSRLFYYRRWCRACAQCLMLSSIFFVLGIVAAALAVRGFSANGAKAEQRKARPAGSGEHPKK